MILQSSNRRSYKGTKGFTVPELMMATAIFSVVLILCITGFMQLGRIYYHGVAITQTKNIASGLLSSISSELQSINTAPSLPDNPSLPEGNYCFGKHLYRVKKLNLVNLSNHDIAEGEYGLLRLDGSCLPDNMNAAKELLGNNMRLLDFTVTSITSAATGSLYEVRIKIASGNDDSLTKNGSDIIDKESKCAGGPVVNQSCAITDIRTLIYSGR